MNKLSALDAYKISVILEGVPRCGSNVVIESGEAVLLGHAEVEHGRRDGRNDVAGDHARHGAAAAPREGICPPGHPPLGAQRTLEQAPAPGDPGRDPRKPSALKRLCRPWPSS